MSNLKQYSLILSLKKGKPYYFNLLESSKQSIKCHQTFHTKKPHKNPTQQNAHTKKHTKKHTQQNTHKNEHTKYKQHTTHQKHKQL